MSRVRDIANILSGGSSAIATDAEITSAVSAQSMAGKNLVINGAFDIWQRATSTSHGSGIFVADRWRGDQGAGGGDYTTSRQSVSTGEPFNYCARITRTSTATTPSYFYTAIESVNSIIAKGNTVTLSFYARKGSGFSGVLVAHLYSGTGTDQGTPHGFTNLVDNASNINLTTSFQRFTITTSSALSTSTNQLGVTFNTVNQTGTPTNDYVEITGVQLELGSVATSFSRAGGDIQGELAKCQRYYYKAVTGVNFPAWTCAYYTSSTVISTVRFPVTMRTSPTFAVTTGTDYYLVVAGGGLDGLSSLTQEVGTADAATIYNNTNAAGTIGYGGNLISYNASSSIAWSAEL
jgi:hypothetical protein